MKQLLTLFLVVSVVVVSVPLTVAQDDAGTTEIEQTEEQITEDVGLLPNNPFYFLKEWGRGVRRALIFDPVKRAEFELEVTDEKAEELRRVGETESDNTLAIQRASENYEKAMERLRLRLEKAQENSENPNVDQLLGRVTERIGEHERRFEQISDRFEDVNKLRERIRNARDHFQGIVDPELIDVEDIDQLKDRAEKVFEERRGELKERLEDVDFRGLSDQVDRFKDRIKLEVEDRDLQGRIKVETQKRVGDLRDRVEKRIDMRNTDSLDSDEN